MGINYSHESSTIRQIGEEIRSRKNIFWLNYITYVANRRPYNQMTIEQVQSRKNSSMKYRPIYKNYYENKKCRMTWSNYLREDLLNSVKIQLRRALISTIQFFEHNIETYLGHLQGLYHHPNWTTHVCT